MNKTFAGLVAFAFAVVLILSSSLPVFAASNVTYVKGAEKYIYSPGSKYSLSDIFPDFKNLMPGDIASQTITVRNDASNGVKVKIYVRSRGAHEKSAEFLSKLHMTVTKTEYNVMEYMFDAAADQTDGMTDWVYLGTLYSGGEVDIVATVHVPMDLGDEYQGEVGYIDWEFMVEELPIDPDDPVSPPTGDGTDIYVWFLMVSVLILLLLLVFSEKRRRKESY